jgi:alkaline phosphatase
MAKYIDGFVLPVAKKNLAAYRKMSQVMAKIMKKYGALEYIEAVGDDLNPKMMGMNFVKFPQMTKAKPGETVMFSFIIYKSRAHRDAANAKMMKDPAMNDPKMKDMPMPFDMKRMAVGGFKAIVEL